MNSLPVGGVNLKQQITCTETFSRAAQPWRVGLGKTLQSNVPAPQGPRPPVHFSSQGLQETSILAFAG